jgi:hypothetical protein
VSLFDALNVRMAVVEVVDIQIVDLALLIERQ